MSETPSLPGSPGGPLQAATAERVNQQRESIFSHLRSESRDSSVHDKISQFNNLSVSLQSKQLERKTADAALKRAMLGREEAETEMRRYRDEVRAMQKAVEEGKDRERRVGERLETLMVSYACIYSFIPTWNTNRPFRKTMAEPRRHTHTHKPYGRKKFDEHEKRRSRHNHPLSSYKRSSSQPAALSR